MNEISLLNSVDNLPISVEYNGMVENIKTNLPAIQKDANNFYKSSSQFKNVTLDVTDLTPISSLKHILAVIDQTKMALQEATISYKRNKIKRDMKFVELEKVEGNEKDLLLLDIQELENQMVNMENSMKGAIRKLNFFVNQYKAILKKLGKTHITEEEYELEENRYHIMTALKQALNAARTRGGIIDEGNHIYLFELGINGAVAQAEVLKYLQAEEKLIIEGKEPSHDMTVYWLEQCADKFVGSAIKFAENRGFVSLDQESLVKELSNE
jgi:hypothetical protein